MEIPVAPLPDDRVQRIRERTASLVAATEFDRHELCRALAIVEEDRRQQIEILDVVAPGREIGDSLADQWREIFTQKERSDG